MKKFITRLKNIGPGALVAAAFIGPGTVTSCSKSGASYGYVLLWAMLLSVISVIIMQSMAARLGIVSKMGLGEALRAKFTGKAARIVLAVLVIAAVFIGNIAYETGNITGSVLGAQTAITGLDNQTGKIILALAIGIIAFILLISGSYKYIEKFLTALVVLMGVLFFVTAIAAKPDWLEVLKGIFCFKVPDVGEGNSTWMTIAALMGTTVVPYNIYLHASSSAKKWGESKDEKAEKSEEDPVKEGLANSRFDSVLSIGLGGLISMAIIICAGAAKESLGDSFAINSGADMANSLKPLLGNWATVLFGIGLFAAGISSAITAPLAAAFASTGILGWSDDLKDKKFRIFWIIVLVIGVTLACTLGASPTEIILFAQAANAFLLPVTGILLLIVANDKKIMKEHTNKLWFNILVVLVIGLFIFIAVRNMSAFIDGFKALING